MQKTALVIMAAGIGSRFGNGIKQLAPVGPNGEIIMDYSIHDALEAGFNKVVFIIRKDLEEEFRESNRTTVSRRSQKLNMHSRNWMIFRKALPNRQTVPNHGEPVRQYLQRRKSWYEPFMVINADDYYGKEAYVKVHDYLVQEQPTGWHTSYLHGRVQSWKYTE